MVGRNPVFKLDLSIFQEGGHRNCLEYRSWLCRPSGRHIEHFSELSLLVFLEIDHRSYRSCLNVHNDYASAYDILLCRHVLSQGLVRQILDVNVQGGPDVKSVLHCYDAAVHILDHALSVGDLHPFEAFLAMKVVVVLSLDSDMARSCVAVMLYISDDSSGKAVIRILPCVFLFHDHSASVRSLVEKRELLKLQQHSVVYALDDRHISFLVASSGKDEVAVVSCILTFFLQHERKLLRELLCLCHPLVLLLLAFLPVLHCLELLLQHVAVHVYVVHRS